MPRFDPRLSPFAEAAIPSALFTVGAQVQDTLYQMGLPRAVSAIDLDELLGSAFAAVVEACREEYRRRDRAMSDLLVVTVQYETVIRCSQTEALLRARSLIATVREAVRQETEARDAEVVAALRAFAPVVRPESLPIEPGEEPDRDDPALLPFDSTVPVPIPVPAKNSKKEK
jgi:hypothetical protein